MPAHITLSKLTYITPDGRSLFDNLDLGFGAERTGLVGRNGAGKTTLLRLILGELAPSAGWVGVTGRLGVLRQAVQSPAGAIVAEVMGAAADLARLRRIEAGQGDEDDLADADWTLEARLDEALAAVDLDGLDLQRPAGALSGGELTRAALAGLLASEPDLLILDEPTNNLDAVARDIVAEVLSRWRGGAIVVSHDRALLRPMDRIVELSGLGVQVFGGGYDLYADRRAEARAAADRALEDARKTTSRIARETQVARERKARRDGAGKRFAASGSAPKIVLGMMAERAENSGGAERRLAERLKAEAAERLSQAEAQVERLRPLNFDLPSAGLPPGRVVLDVEEMDFDYDGRAILEGVTLRLTGPERVALVGPNGSGKTTLLRLLARELQPSRGVVRTFGRMAMLDQRTSILDGAATVLDAFRRLNPEDADNACRAALARFLFRAEAALTPVGQLSGGERLRAGLACVLGGVHVPELLILDEPTNHLDLDSIAAVEAALRGYDGALLVVSHDEDFLQAIGIGRRVAFRRSC